MFDMLEDLKLQHKNASGELWLVPSVQENLLGFRQIGRQSTEAGGVLLGYRRGRTLKSYKTHPPYLLMLEEGIFLCGRTLATKRSVTLDGKKAVESSPI